MPLDCTYRIEVPHRPGELERVAGAIARSSGLIGDIETVSLGNDASLRDVTVQVRDEAHAWTVGSDLGALEGVRLIWSRDRAFIRHRGGKLKISPATPISSVQDMRDVYTPGVARLCRAIANDPALGREFTMAGQTIAICTNGTRVLGLGNIGPLAALPVMEGKAMFYQQCVGLSAMPILLDTTDIDRFVETVVTIAPGFAGIHLEDIAAPACFEIERRLIEVLDQPVMHDDVHGTGVVALAATIVACDKVGVSLDQAVVGQIGLGAAGFGIASLMVEGGARRVLATDPFPDTHAMAEGVGIEIADLDTVMREADVIVATSGRPGLLTPEMIRPGQVILALTNPEPEIRPRAALAAGASYAFDGSVINNVLGYPGLFKGALEAGAPAITTAMKLAAARAIADLSADAELVPDPLDPAVHAHVAHAVRESVRAGAEFPLSRARSAS